MRDLCECQSHDANCSVWSSGRLQVKKNLLLEFAIRIHAIQFSIYIYIFFFLSFQSQALLRQDDTNGRVAEAFTIEMRDMQSEDSTFETNPHPTGRK